MTVAAGMEPAAGAGSTGVRLGAVRAGDRARLLDVVRATGVFREEEVAVAAELFDETFGGSSAAADAPDGYRFVGAFGEDDRLVGYACYGATPGTAATWDLYWIAVDPALHGAGVGTAIMGEVERRLAAEGAHLVVVETSSRSDYAPTRRFYERLGYVESARVRDFYAPGDDRILLVKRFHVPEQGGERGHHE